VKMANLPGEVSAPKLQQPAAEGPNLKIAIFPMYISGPQTAQRRLMKGINIAIDTSDMFKEVFSTYEVENRPDIGLIEEGVQKKELWKRKSLFTTPEPNMEVVCEEAKKLGVDAVLAVFAEADRNEFSQTAYVINPSKKKVYSGKSTLRPRSRETNDFYKMISKVLDDYRKDR
jgi:hypothetical protein